MEKRDKYQSINQKINLSVRYYRVPPSVDKSTALNSLLEKIHRLPERRPRITEMYPWIKIAALLLPAALVIFAMLLFATGQTHTNTNLEAASFRLPDYTRVVLAPGGTISYKRLFGKRKVNLGGEGYFEVKTGSLFQVVTRSGRIKVLGTRFLVSEVSNILEVSCFEGSVAISANGAVLVLSAGEKSTIVDGVIDLPEAESEPYPPIARFTASYSGEAIKQVFAGVEDFFGVSITVDVPENRIYSGKIDTGNLETVLILICEPLGLRYDFQEDNKIFIHK